MKKKLPLILSLLFSMSLSLVYSATHVVTSTADSGPGTIRSAVDAGADGDSIVFDPSTDGTIITLLSELDVDTKLTIIGNDSTNTILSANNSGRVMFLTDTAYISGIRFQDGYLPSYNFNMGAALMIGNTGVATIEGCRFMNNEGAFGTVHLYYGGDAFIYNSSFYRNIGLGGGPNGGGAVSVTVGIGSELFLENTVFQENEYASLDANGRCGAAIFAQGGTLTMNNCEFIDNVTTAAAERTAQGGAIYLNGFGSFGLTANFEGCSFTGNGALTSSPNRSALGGAVYARYSVETSFNDCIFNNNYCQADTGISRGGAVYIRVDNDIDSVYFYDCYFNGNSCLSGSGLYTSSGGAVSAEDLKKLVFRRSTFANNTVESLAQSALGGAVSTTTGVDTTVFVNNTFYDNSAMGNFGSGGAIDDNASVLIYYNNTFANNYANDIGGGVAFSRSYTSRDVSNNIFANNSTSNNYYDMYWNTTSTFTLSNNLVEDAAPFAYTFAYSSDPGLDPSGVQMNGGPTPTLAIVDPTSEAIDNASLSVAPAFDQRGGLRDGNPDIGAYEYLGCVTTFSSMTTSACVSMTSPSGNYIWSTSGIYNDTVVNALGCDSVMTFDLTILQPTASTFSLVVCDSYTVPSGDETYSMSGVYMDTIPNSVGCDSVMTINLTVNQSTTHAINVTTCNTYTVPSGDETYTVSGTYLDTIPNSVGCDSVLTINLTVNYSSVFTLNEIVCDSYTVPSGDETYTVSGTYMDTIPNSVGCDSVISINLTVNYTTSSSLVLVECDSYTVPSGDETYTSTGTYMDTIPNSMGCDSIITIDLTINNSSANSITISACNSYTVPSGDETYTASGVYMDTLPNSVGCDSILMINLTVNYSTMNTLNEIACDFYTVPSGDETYTMSGVYMDTIPNTSGCDSVITINLTINNSSMSSLNVTECDNYLSPAGATYTMSGIYMDTIPNAVGCDSVITINLTITNSTSSSKTITSCGDYLWGHNGVTYSSSGVYMDTISNAVGCDSVLTLDLTVIHIDTSVTASGITLTANQIGVSYQWIDCDNNNAPISGETNQMFTASVNGNYAVVLTDGVCSDTSSCHSINSVGIDMISEEDVSIYPNPNRGQFRVDFMSDFSGKVDLYNVVGELIQNKEVMGSSYIDFDLRELTTGTYILRINSGLTTMSKLVVIR